MSKKHRSRFTTHLLRIGAYVAATFWLAFTYGGWELVSTSDTGRHSHAAGWVILIIASVLMIITMNHWVKYLRVIIGGGVLGGLLATATGHLPNGKPFPQLIAAILTALLVGCSLISQNLAKRKLSILDRASLIGFLAAFVSGVVKNTPASDVAGLSIGLACLLFPVLCARLWPKSYKQSAKAADI